MQMVNTKIGKSKVRDVSNITTHFDVRRPSFCMPMNDTLVTFFAKTSVFPQHGIHLL